MLTLDCNLPIARQRVMLMEARAKIVIRAGNMASEDVCLSSCQAAPSCSLTLEDDSAINASAPLTRVCAEPEISGDDPAYIFFYLWHDRDSQGGSWMPQRVEPLSELAKENVQCGTS